MQLPNTLKTPSFIQQLNWITDPLGFMEKAAQQYPDIFTTGLNDFGKHMIFVNHPQAIQLIFTNDGKKFLTGGQRNTVLKPLIGDSSVMLQEGERHRRSRQLITSPFHKERMELYGKLICSVTEKFFDQLPQNKPFLAWNAMQDIALEVILQAVFGLTEGEQYQQLKHQITLLLHILQSPINLSFFLFPFLQKDLGAWNAWGRFVRHRQQIDKILYAEIDKRRKQPDPTRTDVLSLLMSVKDEEGQLMTDLELRDQIIALLLAGHETTANAMAWELYWTHRNFEVREKLLQELNSLGGSPDPMSIVKLPYLSAVCNETLRIHPTGILSMPRELQEPVELLGHKLELGTLLVASIYLLHQREDLYPQPKQFRPERFLERQFSPYEFMPFGGGVRRCIAHAFAPFEMKLVLATILRRYQLKLADNRPERPVRRGFATGPARGVKMIVTDRTP
jgi:unspecific monooxygenase